MAGLKPLDVNEVAGESKKLFNAIEGELGMVPNVFRTMAHSPTVFDAYMNFHDALRHGVLSDALRERIALAVSEVNKCAYCLAEHSATALAVGLSKEEICDSRRAISPDRRVETALNFARQVARGVQSVDDSGVGCLRRAGFDDREIAEIIATIVLTVVKNYFNRLAGTVMDYPPAQDIYTW